MTNYARNSSSLGQMVRDPITPFPSLLNSSPRFSCYRPLQNPKIPILPLQAQSFRSQSHSSLFCEETRPSILGFGLGSGTEGAFDSRVRAGIHGETRPSILPIVLCLPTSAKGAADSSDVMEMLLRERIVFLGSQIDDFVADAIIIQLLLLDAIDSTKDIRHFINSPGGSFRNMGNLTVSKRRELYCIIASISRIR